MKKIFAIALSAIMCFGLAACSGGGSTSSKSEGNNTESSEGIEITQQDYYIYDEFGDGTSYGALCYAELTNNSNNTLQITNAVVTLYDANDVSLGECDFPDIAPSIIKPGEKGILYDSSGSLSFAIENPDSVASMEIELDYSEVGDDANSLNVEDETIINDYQYNVSGMGVQCVVENPYDKNVEYYILLAGMYDSEGKLIGVCNSSDSSSIKAGEKIHSVASWLPDDGSVWSNVDSVRCYSCVGYFEE